MWGHLTRKHAATLDRLGHCQNRQVSHWHRLQSLKWNWHASSFSDRCAQGGTSSLKCYPWEAVRRSQCCLNLSRRSKERLGFYQVNPIVLQPITRPKEAIVCQSRSRWQRSDGACASSSIVYRAERCHAVRPSCVSVPQHAVCRRIRDLSAPIFVMISILAYERCAKRWSKITDGLNTSKRSRGVIHV